MRCGQGLTGSLLEPRESRRLVEQQSCESPLCEPKQEHANEPEQQYRVPSCPHASTSPGLLRSGLQQVRNEAFRAGLEERRVRRPCSAPCRTYEPGRGAGLVETGFSKHLKLWIVIC